MTPMGILSDVNGYTEVVKIQDGNRKYFLSFRQDSNAIPMATPIFDVTEFNGAIPNTAQCNLKLEIQDGGR